MTSGAEPAAATAGRAGPRADPGTVGAREITIYFLRLGAVGFGGPIALVGRMHRDLVEERGWITEEEYHEGLALAQLAPGPLAAQLAIYLGWVRAGVWGATLAAVAFVAPSLLIVLAISVLYVRVGGMPWLQGAFYGVGASVIAVIARSAAKLARATLGRDALLWGLCGASALVTAWTATEYVSLVVACGVVAFVVRSAGTGGPEPDVGAAAVVPWPLAPLALGAAPAAGVGLGPLFWFFAKAGAVVFGSGLAIVPFLYGGVVERSHWLTEREFLDAVAVSMITPGPVVITVAFIGYLVAGLPGALAASAGVFLPVYLVVVAAAPHFHRVAASGRVKAFVAGVTAAATGAIAGAVVVLGRRAIVDVPTALVAAGSLAVLLRWRVSEPALLLAAAALGLVLAGGGPR